MKILHVIGDLDRHGGGPPQICVETAELMAKRGHEVRIVTTDHGLPRDLPLDNAYEGGGRLTIEPFSLDAPRFWRTSWAMRRRLAAAVPEADIVHVHSLYLFHDWAAGACCRRSGVPYIVRPHGTLDPFMWQRHRWRKAVVEILFQNDVQRRAAGLHYTTDEERDLARPYAHNPRGWVVPNGVAVPSEDRLPAAGALRARYPAIGDRRAIVFFGRLSFKKGIDVTIGMFDLLCKKRSDIVLVFAGPDAGERSAAERRVAESGLTDRVLFTGMVQGQDKWAVLRGADVFVLPSYSENFGVAAVEAAACRVPVVISDRVNLRRDFEGAALVAPPEAGAFAADVGWLLDNPTGAAAMARRGEIVARMRFGWSALADRYEAMYQDAASFRREEPCAAS